MTSRLGLTVLLVVLALPAAGPAQATAHSTPTVVIDPGHGGSNTGAYAAATGTFEKRLVLDLSRRLAAELKERGIRVVLTRERDEYVTVRERIRLVNRTRPDAFISIHANAAAGPGSAATLHGAETYVLDGERWRSDTALAAGLLNEALDGVGPAAGARARGGKPLRARDLDVASILRSLSATEHRLASARLALAVQRALERGRGDGPSGTKGVRQAPLNVLRQVEAPAVLAEIGYLTHPDDARLLARPEVVTALARSLADALACFVHERALAPEKAGRSASPGAEAGSCAAP